MTTTFARLGLSNSLVDALSKIGISEPFPIQSAVLPDALAGRDISGKAPTGSGKTLAFGLPLLETVAKAGRNRPRGLILAPTRELAEQIKQDLAPLARAADKSVLAVYGGVSYGPQKGGLRKGVDILVATPGRLEDLIAQRAADLRLVDIAVVDEADRMADMGFMPAVRRILDGTSRHRQTLLFSATLDGDIAVLSRDYQQEPVRHEAGSVEAQAADARHHFWLVGNGDRIEKTAEVVRETGRSIVFTRTRHGADRLAKQLTRLGVYSVAMHGGRSQSQRSRALHAFSSGRAQALVATDVAARGIHVEAVPSVVHFDPPADHKAYLHRSGRTARAGASGTVVSMVTGGQKQSVRRMQRALGIEARIEEPRSEALAGNGVRLQESPPGGQEDPSSRTPATGPQETRSDRRADRSQSVYVANLPWKATAEDVRSLFGRYGAVHQATIITDRRTGRSRGFGFVDMTGPAARTAVAELHGSDMNGRDLTVRLARPRRQRG